MLIALTRELEWLFTNMTGPSMSQNAFDSNQWKLQIQAQNIDNTVVD